MMKKLFAVTAISALMAAPGAVMAQAAAPAAPAAAAETSPHTFTANVSVVSDYRFRGISQSFKLPAVQGGFDYSHESGIYLGNWNSSISGVEYPNGASLEMDFYGGWKKTFAEDFGLDLGVLYYYYPGTEFAWNTFSPPFGFPTSGNSKPNNFEAYIGLSWKWLTFKYSYAFTNYFGLTSAAAQNFFFDTSSPSQSAAAYKGYGPFGSQAKDSKGSMYYDLTATYPVIDKVNLIGHVGYLHVANYNQYNYWDYKLGVTYEFPNTWVVGAAFIATTSKDQWYTYCSSTSCKNVGNNTGVVTLTKTF